jgi:hypothetical protein
MKPVLAPAVGKVRDRDRRLERERQRCAASRNPPMHDVLSRHPSPAS